MPMTWIEKLLYPGAIGTYMGRVRSEMARRPWTCLADAVYRRVGKDTRTGVNFPRRYSFRGVMRSVPT